MLDLTSYPDVKAVLDDYLAALQGEFGDQLLAVYLLGSLSTNSYVPGWSDINGVIVTGPAEPAQLTARARAARQAVLQSHPAWQASLFACCIPVETLRNTAWHDQPDCWSLVDMTNLVEDGGLLWGQDLRAELLLPNLEQLRACLVAQLIELLEASQAAGRRAFPLRAPDRGEWEQYCQHPRELVDWLIYPARWLLTWDKGRVGSKTEAVNHYIEDYHGPWEPVLLQADTLRRTGSLDALAPSTLAVFAEHTPGLFEWMLKRLLSILVLPDDLAGAAQHLRRWLERDPSLPRVPGLPYDTFAPGEMGERVDRPQSPPDQPPDVFIPHRKPWLREPD